MGRPLGLMLTRSTEHATVTLCHEATQDTAAHARVADVVVAEAGVAHLVKPGATVLSVGLTGPSRAPSETSTRTSTRSRAPSHRRSAGWGR